MPEYNRDGVVQSQERRESDLRKLTQKITKAESKAVQNLKKLSQETEDIVIVHPKKLSENINIILVPLQALFEN